MKLNGSTITTLLRKKSPTLMQQMITQIQHCSNMGIKCNCNRKCQIFPYRDKGNKNLQNLMNTYKYINDMNNINNDAKVSNRDKWGK